MSADRRLRLHTDGASRGNPGPAGLGAVIADAADGAVIEEITEYLGRVTNNVAEYRALLAALRRAADLGAGAVEVYSDSELMVRQLQGRYQVKSADLRPLHEEARRRLRAFPGGFELRHTLRGGNARADRLANQAIDQALGRPGPTATDPEVLDLGAVAAALDPGRQRDVGAGLRLARLAPGAERSAAWVMVLQGAVRYGGTAVAAGCCGRGAGTYRAMEPHGAVVLESRRKS